MEVVEHEHDLALLDELVDEPRQHDLEQRRGRDQRRQRRVRRAPGRRGTSASITCDHSTTASLSPSSSVTHATGRSRASLSRHAASSVDLPKPAGHATRLSRTAAAVAQPLEQPLARDRLRRDERRVQLGDEQDRSENARSLTRLRPRRERGPGGR